MIPRMITIKPNVEEWTIEELKDIPDLDKLKSALDGGLLEIVPRFNTFRGTSCVALVDEEGKMKNLEYNIVAQKLWEESIGRTIKEDYLVGPLVIIEGSLSFLSRL
jgi:hypothetical protein